MGTFTKLHDLQPSGLAWGWTACGQIIPMNDGRLLITDLSGQLGIISPDLFGEYTIINKLPTNPYNMYGSPAMVLNDGRVVVMGGHAGYSGQYVIAVFDPLTDSVSYLLNQTQVSHDGRYAWQYLDDGRIMAPRLNGEIYLNPNTLAITVGTATVASLGESNLSLIPDGRLLGFDLQKGYISIFSPTYSADYVLQGSYPGNSTITLGAPVFEYAPGVPDQSWMYKIAGLNQGPWHPAVDVGLLGELGGCIYMPKIDKVVITGGWAGEIFAIDPSSVQSGGKAIIRATLPQDNSNGWGFLNPNDPNGVATLDPSHNGQTPAQIVASGTLKLKVPLGSGYGVNIVCVQTIDGWCLIKATTRSVSGTTVTFTGLSLDYGSHLSPVVSESLIFTGNPNARCAESWVAILPSGTLFYPAGRSFGNYSAYNKMYLWDGVSTQTTLEPAVQIPSYNLSFNFHGCVAPNGQFIMSDGRSVWKYQESAAPELSYAPTITNVPTNLQRGKSYTLSGKQLSGRHIGSIHGDDFGGHSNIGLVKLVAGNGVTYWARTSNWTYRGIAANRASSMQFTLPADIPDDNYRLYAVSCGISSDPVSVTVGGSGGESIFFARY